MIPVNIINGGYGYCPNGACNLLPPPFNWNPYIFIAIAFMLVGFALTITSLVGYLMYRKMRKYFVIAIILLIVPFASAQASEITSQNVRINDYVRQYAVIQYVNTQGSAYFDYCMDCNCTAKVYNDRLQQLRENITCTEIETGLFGFRATTDTFEPTKNYVVSFTCESVSYGNGSVNSDVYVYSSQEAQTLNLASDITSTATGVTAPSSTWDIWKIFNPSLGEMIERLLSSGKDLIGLTSIDAFFYRLGELISGITDLILGLISILIYLITWVYTLFTDPKQALYDILVIFWIALMLIIPFLAIIEMGIFVIILKRRHGAGDLMGLISDFINIHIDIFSFVFVILDGVISLIIKLTSLIIELIAMIRGLFKI